MLDVSWYIFSHLFSSPFFCKAGTPESMLDDRKQKHVSFDSSSLLRSQTLSAVDEASFQRTMVTAACNTSDLDSQGLNSSSERLIDGRKTPDFEYYSQVFPPDIARQLMIGKEGNNEFFFFQKNENPFFNFYFLANENPVIESSLQNRFFKI